MLMKRGIRLVKLLQTGNYSILRCRKHFSVTALCKGKKDPVVDEGPVAFSTSRAASWSMTNVLMAPKRDIPWYQPLSVVCSVGAFLIYFLCLREENDLDMELNYSLFERVPQLEEHQLKLVLEYNRSEGKDTADIEKRLSELQRQKEIESSKH